MKSNVQKHFKTKSKLRAYNQGGAVACPNCGKYHNGGACYMADGGDIISRGNQRIDDAIAAMEQGNPAPVAQPDMSSTLQAHPVNPSVAGGFPTDKTPVLDRAFETMIKLGLRAGGPVRGPGGPKEDKIPAMLSNGEYVLPADTVQAVGKEKLDTLRAQTHKFADGGGASYTGDVFQQFDQALGDQPRTLQSNPGTERLHSLFDSSLGFRNTPSTALDHYDNTFQFADGGIIPYPKAWAGQQPGAEDETAYPRDPAGSSRLRFMRDGGGIPYPEEWTGDPRIRFLANGGFPDASGLEVEEIPTQTLGGAGGGSPLRLDARFTGAQAAQPFPGPEGIHVNEIPNTASADLDSTIGARARAAKAVRAGSPFMDAARGAAGDAAEAVGSGARTAGSAIANGASKLRAGIAGLPGRVAGGARSIGGAALAPVAAFEGIKTGINALNVPSEEYAKRYGVKLGGDGVGAFAKDLGVRALGVTQDLGNNLLGLVGMRQDGQGAAPPQAPVSSQGGGASAGGGGTPQGTAVINGRTVSPQEISALNDRNVIPAGTSPFPDAAGPGQGVSRTDRSDQSGGVFHMPQSNPGDEINSRIDALAKKIGPIGHSAARLRALQGLEGERTSALTQLAGQGSQERVADKGLQATIAQRTWDRNLDAAKFGIESGRLNRQLAHDNATLGLEQAKYRDGLRGDILTNKLPQMMKGLDGIKLDEKGNPDGPSQQRMARITRLISNGTDVAQLPQAMLPQITKLADMADKQNMDQDGFAAIVKQLALGGTRGKTEDLGNALPQDRQKGAFIDTVSDRLGRRRTLQGTLRGTLNPLVAPDYDIAREIPE